MRKRQTEGKVMGGGGAVSEAYYPHMHTHAHSVGVP